MYGLHTEQLSAYILDCAERNDSQHIDYYMSYGGNAHLKDHLGRNAAHLFALKSNTQGLDQIALNDLKAFEVFDDAGLTPLMYLAQNSAVNVAPYVEEWPQLLLQANNHGHTVAGFLAARGQTESIIKNLLPLCPEIAHQKVIAMVMASTTLSPKEKLTHAKLLADAGFTPQVI